MNSNLLTYEDIEDIIDSHMQSESNFLFACEASLAQYICDYLLDEYDLSDENGNEELYTDTEEFYVSVCFEDDKILCFCEDAKGISGEYKLSDSLSQFSYFVGLEDMTNEVMFKKLRGDEGIWVRFTMVDGMEDNGDEENCCCCDCCREDELMTVNKLLDIYTERILDTQGCPDCIREILDDLVDEIIYFEIEK